MIQIAELTLVHRFATGRMFQFRSWLKCMSHRLEESGRSSAARRLPMNETETPTLIYLGPAGRHFCI
jgi:hypothetical protein